MYNRLVFCLISLVFIVSCASKKDVYYFQDIDQTPIENNFSLINIQPGDILDIQIKALNQESVLIFQRQGNLGLQQQYLQNRVLDGYIVGDDGTINIPLLGSISKNQTPKPLLMHSIGIKFFYQKPFCQCEF